MPIVALFYTDNGLDDYDIYVLQAVYSLSVALLEIPSGYMADMIGRKKSLVIGSVLGTLGYSIYSFSSGFYGFFIAALGGGLIAVSLNYRAVYFSQMFAAVVGLLVISPSLKMGRKQYSPGYST